ncbi:MAG: cell division protein FtsZ [Candidatus Electryoneaceae bacterium]|nr:cell division protein FtsZ [Candidatus Electryoneaceae bacterium]
MGKILSLHQVAEQTKAVRRNLVCIGCGGGGSNAIDYMVKAGLFGVKLIAINTDDQALNHCQAPFKLQIGEKLTGGEGAGSDPEIGRKAAMENLSDIEDHIEGCDLLFLCAGMGGGTGTGAISVVAEAARDAKEDILTVAIVTKPFAHEGDDRMRVAEEGIEQLFQIVDTIVVIPNERLLELDPNIGLLNAFDAADSVLMKATRGVSSIISNWGRLNVDLADARRIMTRSGLAMLGMGNAKGTDRANLAVQMALHNPLIEADSIDGARGVLINFTCPPTVKLSDVTGASDLVKKEAGPQAKVKFGVVIDETMESDELKIMVIATGFKGSDGFVVPKRTDYISDEEMSSEVVVVTEPSKKDLPRTNPQSDQRNQPHQTSVQPPVQPVEPVQQTVTDQSSSPLNSDSPVQDDPTLSDYGTSQKKPHRRRSDRPFTSFNRKPRATNSRIQEQTDDDISYPQKRESEPKIDRSTPTIWRRGQNSNDPMGDDN